MVAFGFRPSSPSFYQIRNPVYLRNWICLHLQNRTFLHLRDQASLRLPIPSFLRLPIPSFCRLPIPSFCRQTWLNLRIRRCRSFEDSSSSLFTNDKIALPLTFHCQQRLIINNCFTTKDVDKTSTITSPQKTLININSIEELSNSIEELNNRSINKITNISNN